MMNPFTNAQAGAARSLIGVKNSVVLAACSVSYDSTVKVLKHSVVDAVCAVQSSTAKGLKTVMTGTAQLIANTATDAASAISGVTSSAVDTACAVIKTALPAWLGSSAAAAVNGAQAGESGAHMGSQSASGAQLIDQVIDFSASAFPAVWGNDHSPVVIPTGTSGLSADLL